MKKSLAAMLLILGANAEAGKYWGFDFSTGPGYRQDRVEWKIPTNKEFYPHLRMFDWAVSFDANLGGVHLIGEGDRGWFSSQEMQKSVDTTFPSTASFTYSTSGKATSAFLYLGYELGSRNTISLTPMVGWLYDEEVLHRSRPVPPFNRLTQNVPAPFTFAEASVQILSNLRQKWQGALLGASLSLQLLKGWILQGSYAYGWLHVSQSFSEQESILFYLPGPTPSTRVETIVQGDTSGGGGRGNLGKVKMLIFLSPNVSLNFDVRYFSLNSGEISTLIQDSSERLEATLSSILFTTELNFRF